MFNTWKLQQVKQSKAKANTARHVPSANLEPVPHFLHRQTRSTRGILKLGLRLLQLADLELRPR